MKTLALLALITLPLLSCNPHPRPQPWPNPPVQATLVRENYQLPAKEGVWFCFSSQYRFGIIRMNDAYCSGVYKVIAERYMVEHPEIHKYSELLNQPTQEVR